MQKNSDKSKKLRLREKELRRRLQRR